MASTRSPFPISHRATPWTSTIAPTPAQSFLTSRGCPYHCAYCFNVAMGRFYGSEWFRRRLRSPENVVREIEAVRAGSGISFVQFRCAASSLTSGSGWKSSPTSIPAAIGLPFYAHVRANHASAEVVSLLAPPVARV